MQMEMLEMELIKKLQNTQAIQKQAYTELEEAINNRPVMTVNSQNPYGQFRGNGSGGGMNSLNVAMGQMNINGGANNESGGLNGEMQNLDGNKI